MKPIKILIARIRCRVHCFLHLHFRRVQIYNKPGHCQLQFIKCESCQKIFYVNEVLERLILDENKHREMKMQEAQYRAARQEQYDNTSIR